MYTYNIRRLYRINEPMVVGRNVRPDVTSRDCCANCTDRNAHGKCEELNMLVPNHFWCSSHTRAVPVKEITEKEVM